MARAKTTQNRTGAARNGTGKPAAAAAQNQRAKAGKTQRRGRILALVLIAVMLLSVVPYPVYSFVQQQMYPMQYSDLVEKWSAEFGVNPYFVYAIIRTESSFDPNAESTAGARGLMQMTKDTFDWLKPTLATGEAISFNDLYDPNTSIRFGVYFLSLSIQRYGGDLSTAAAAYHSGWGTVDQLLDAGEYTQDGVHLTAFPYEQMNHYVNKVNKNYKKYLSLYSA